MNKKSKDNRNVCRLVVVKIVDSGPIVSDNSDLDEQINVRQSPQQKRPASPVSITNGVISKKVKLESTTNNIKKKPVQSIVNKTITNTKKTKLVPHKSSSMLEEKTSKILPIKETVNENNEIKSRPLTKLVKSQSTNNINISIQSTISNTKKKESILSPTKIKSNINSQNILKKPLKKNLSKTSIKTENISNSFVKSPLNINIKQESSPQSITNTIPSVSISNLKKIPKKSIIPKIEEKRSRSLVPSSSNKNTIRNSQKQPIVSSKTKSNLKRDPSSSSINTSIDQSQKKTKNIKDQSKPPTPSKSVYNSPQTTPIEPSINSIISSSLIDTTQSTNITSPLIQNEDNHIQAPMDIEDQLQLSEKSNSPYDQNQIESSNQVYYSDQSDTNDSNISLEDDNNNNIPIILDNDDLRYKLIFIYKRFQLNLINDLIIFVKFFKRHQLIDISSISMTKSTNEMFTYDLFLLNPSQIGELANDLGYTSMNIIE